MNKRLNQFGQRLLGWLKHDPLVDPIFDKLAEVEAAPKRTTQQANFDDVKRRFAGDIAEHGLIVLRDEGEYRHLRFKKPGTYMYHFDVTTWPGHLAFTGDMGDLLFSRHGTSDMFEMFRSRHISQDYWAEKVKAGETRTFSLEAYKQSIREFFENYTDDWYEEDDEGNEHPTAERHALWTAIENELLDSWQLPGGTPEAFETISQFRYSLESGRTWYFEDFYEYPVEDYTFHYLWACLAIHWGIQQYDRLKEAAA